MNINPTELIDVEIDGIETWGYPDFCDAYLNYACRKDGTELTEAECEWVTEHHSDWVHEEAHKSWF